MRFEKKNKATADATLVFKGTVKQLRASNVKQAAVSDRTVIVTVDEVIEAPPNLAAYKGQDITVEVSSSRKVNVGDRMLFHAISWLFGESIAVHSLYEEADTTQTSGTRRNAVARSSEKQIREHFENADLVVSGRVIEVRLPKPTSARIKRTSTSNTTTRVSEHDPKWREAVIEVEEVHKGSPAKRRVTVRFPASTDVAWRRAPKLEAGQQGYFMLHQATEANHAKSKTLSRKKGSPRSRTRPLTQTYIVRHPDDFTPYNQAEKIESLPKPDR